MSDPEIEPDEDVVEDTAPETTANPGGADAVVDDPDSFPPVTPDQPQSAQLSESDVPDEIEEPDDTGEADESVREPPA